MAKSRSKKMRDRQTKMRGYDLHAMRRGHDIPLQRKTKTKQEALLATASKHKRKTFDAVRDQEFFYFYCFLCLI